MEEEWRDIPGYEGLYQVSSIGRVKSLRSNYILKPYKDKNGYLHVIFIVNGQQKNIMIHRLVALLFLPKIEVNHKDGNKANNTVSNLEWVTRSENILHAFRTGLILMPGDKKRKDWKGYIDILTDEGKFVAQTDSLVDAAKWIRENTEYKNAADDNIGRACRGNNKRKTAYGFIFKRSKNK